VINVVYYFSIGMKCKRGHPIAELRYSSAFLWETDSIGYSYLSVIATVKALIMCVLASVRHEETVVIITVKTEVGLCD